MRRVALAVALVACGNGSTPKPAGAPSSGLAAGSTAGSAASSAPASTAPQPTSDAASLRDDLLARPATDLPPHALRRLGTEAFRHPSGGGLQATPDGSRLMSWDHVGLLRTWDVATGKLLGEMKTFVGGLLLPDGKRVITDKGVHSVTGELIAPTPSGSRAVASAKYVIIINKPTAVVYDATTLAKVGAFKVRDDIDGVAIAPDESAIAVASDSLVTTYKLPAGTTGKVVRFDAGVDDVTFIGPTKIAANTEIDRVVVHDLVKDTRVLDYKSKAEIAIVTHLTGVRDGKRLVVTINGSDSQLVDIEKKQATPLATFPSVGISAVELGTTGIMAVQTTDGIRMFDLATSKQVRIPDGHQETVTGLAFAGGALLSGSDDGTVLRWNVVDGKQAARAAIEGGADAIALSPDGKRLAVAGNGGGVFDATTLAEIDGRSGVNDVAWVGNDAVHVGLVGSIQIGGKYLDDIDCGSVCQLAVTAKGEVAMGDDNGQKLVIAPSFADVAKAPRIEVCGYIRSIDRTSTHVAFAADSCAELYDASGRLVLTFARTQTGEHTIRTLRLTSVAFSADGKHLATGWDDGLVEIREAATGKVTKSFTGHRDDITALAFDAAGGLLASGSSDGTIVIWNAW